MPGDIALLLRGRSRILDLHILTSVGIVVSIVIGSDQMTRLSTLSEHRITTKIFSRLHAAILKAITSRPGLLWQFASTVMSDWTFHGVADV